MYRDMEAQRSFRQLGRRLLGLRRYLATHSRSVPAASHGPTPLSNLEKGVYLPYPQLQANLQTIRRRLDRPLTLSEKILYSHLYQPEIQELERGKSSLQIRPDRAACHDATATMAMLQFITAGLCKVALPTSIHSDHLIVAEKGAIADLEKAKADYAEVYDFLSSVSKKYNIGFWKPGSGIIHTIIFENYAFPGGLIIGTDSHTPNAGGMGMLGIGVGGADAVDAMTGMPWELQCPKILGVRLTGRLRGWASSKDIMLNIAGQISVSGGKGKIIEFFGPGTRTLGATAMATVCNMSAEVGSTSCIFPYSNSIARYLEATDRDFIASAADAHANLLTADAGSAAFYDDIIEIDLHDLEPHVNGPFTPDLSHPLSRFAANVKKSDWPQEISHALIGSCTNASYEDLSKAARIFREANEAGLKPKVPVFVTAGSEKIRSTVESEGILAEFEQAGAVVLSNSCGPCVGQWHRHGAGKGEANSVISSYNRNFVGRHDGNAATHSFVTSPELVAAFAFSGSLDFNPAIDSIDVDKAPFTFTRPEAEQYPKSFADGTALYQAPPEDGSDFSVIVSPTSDSLQLLSPFSAWESDNAKDMTILIKVKGKCTTDHISPAGPWYKYRGHLENISNNLLTAAENAFLRGPSNRGLTINGVSGKLDSVPALAKEYKKSGIKWCIIGDANYGEGSSREHAALEPRFLNGVAVIAKSFARIHETNLKKQGVLALTFVDPTAYDRIGPGDKITVEGVESMRPGCCLTMVVRTPDGYRWESQLEHSYHMGQIKWLKYGSALNAVRNAKM